MDYKSGCHDELCNALYISQENMIFMFILFALLN